MVFKKKDELNFILFSIFYILFSFYNESIPSSSLASTPIMYEITATDKDIIAIVAKFFKNGSYFATDI